MTPEPATRGVLSKKVFLKISQHSQDCKIHSLRPATLLKKRPWYRFFHVNFAKFLRKPFSQNTTAFVTKSDTSYIEYLISCLQKISMEQLLFK